MSGNNNSQLRQAVELAQRYFAKVRDIYGEELIGQFSLELPKIEKIYPSLDAFCQAVKDCRKCSLWKSRTNFVFGAGNPNARMMLIGEAPGRDEDIQGIPFVGRAGQLLTRILKAINLEREEVYIANILKCRPPGNRDPVEEEVRCCEPYLKKQIKMINPHIIVALGRVAAQNLLKTKKNLGELRGKEYIYRGVKLVVTYHPAAILRNPNLKRPTWEDVQWIRKLYDKE